MPWSHRRRRLFDFEGFESKSSLDPDRLFCAVPIISETRLWMRFACDQINRLPQNQRQRQLTSGTSVPGQTLRSAPCSNIRASTLSNTILIEALLASDISRQCVLGHLI